MTKLNTLPFIVALRKRYGQRMSRSRLLVLSLLPGSILVLLGLGSIAIFGADAAAGAFGNSFLRWILRFTNMLVLGFATYLRVRRLHDFNVSGWWSLVFLVPIPEAFATYVHTALYLVLLLIPGTTGPNRYGDRAIKERLEGIPTYDGRPPF